MTDTKDRKNDFRRELLRPGGFALDWAEDLIAFAEQLRAEGHDVRMRKSCYARYYFIVPAPVLPGFLAK